jgi:predicted phage tail protein
MPYEDKEGLRRFSTETNKPYSLAYPAPETELRLSQTIAATWDLICEGPISGLVGGEYTYVGTKGNVGWTSATYTEFDTVTSTNPAPLSSYTVPGYLRSVYWNEVPVLNKNSQVNFQQVDILKTYGTPNGESLQGGLYSTNSELKTTRPIGERLRGSSDKYDYSKSYKIYNPNCNIIKVNFRIPALSKTYTRAFPSPNNEEESDGEVHEAQIEIKLEYSPLWSPKKVDPSTRPQIAPSVSIVGKVHSPTIFSATIETYNSNTASFYSDPEFLGWEIKITRTTPDSGTTSLINQTYIDSISEWTDLQFTYPNCAVIRSAFNAEYFSQVPQRAFDCRMLRVKVPSNYNTILKTYDGEWDGTFKDEKEWTDNPAWCYYDLITNKRYGLGKYISEDEVDKWGLYQIAKYCDTLVSNGKGGLEPRFTCNLYLTAREDAFKVLNDMASIFHAITYYAFGSVYTVQDRPKDPIVQFTNANVENGEFVYSSSSKRARHTVAIIRYNDPDNFYKSAIEYVEDIESVRRYGVREIELVAFGCTSKGQARRLGAWALLSELLETETVSFTTGLEGAYLRPGDIFKIFDTNRKTQRTGGRIISLTNGASTSTVVLDSEVTLDSSTSYTISIIIPTYNYEASQVDGLTSADSDSIRRTQMQEKTFLGSAASTVNGRTQIVFNEIFENLDGFVDHAVWTLQLSAGATTIDEDQSFLSENIDYYRVIRIEEQEDNKYSIAALQYNEDKYDENEERLSQQSSTTTINAIPVAPSGALLLYEPNGLPRDISYAFVPGSTNFSGVNTYRVFAKQDRFTSESVPSTSYLVAELPYDIHYGTYTVEETGNYFFRIYAHNNVGDIYSTGYTQASGAVLAPSGHPQKITNVTISSLRIANDTGAFSSGSTPTRSATVTLLSPTFTWQHGRSNNQKSKAHAFRLTIREPSQTSIPSSTIYYENTGIDYSAYQPTFEFGFTTVNNSDIGGPYRNYDVVVEAIDQNGYTSAGNTVYSATSRYEDGWGEHPDGYDIINVNNPRPSGFNISSGTSHPSGYVTIQHFTPSYDMFCIFSGAREELPTDVAGCFMYYSTTPFTPTDAKTGLARIHRTRGTFDNSTYTAYAHFAAPQAIKTGYFAISLFDEFDNTYYGTDNSFATGLHPSNVAPIVSRAGASNFTFHGESGKTYFLDTRMNGSFVELVLVDSTDLSNVIILN